MFANPDMLHPYGGEVTTKCLAYLYGTYVGHIRQGERIRESKEMIDESPGGSNRVEAALVLKSQNFMKFQQICIM